MHWNRATRQRPGIAGLIASGAAATLLASFLLIPPPATAMTHPLSPQDGTTDAADDGSPDELAEQAETSESASYRTEKVRGRVGWLADALKEQFGISSVPEVSEHMLALVTADGEVIPLVENIRGRAFRKDKRLREMEVEILLRRHQKQPMAQVLRLYELRDGKRFEVDYWCDVCAIPMYETGPCSCCQDHNRLRKRLIEDKP